MILARIVLGLHLAGGLTERPCEALGIDRQVSGGRKLGDESRGVQRLARSGEDPDSLPTEPDRRHDLVARLGRRGIEHSRRSEMRADPQSHSEPYQALGNGVIDDAADDDVRIEPGAISEKAGEFCARRGRPSTRSRCTSDPRSQSSA